jgi:hypothetical protein
VRAARSVDSEYQSRAIEPRNNQMLEPSLSRKRGQHRSAAKARRRGPAGVQEKGKGTLGFSGNLGGPQNVLEHNPGKDEPG